MKQIDERLNLICEFINEFTISNGYAPTVREIGSYLKISSTSMIQYYLTKLSASGRIAKSENKNRTLSVSQIKTSKGNSKQATYVPLVGDISAGKGILAVENIEEYYPIPVDMFGANSDDETFMLKVRGQSMTDAGINDGDLVIVHRQDAANNGDIVVALWEEEISTIKRFYKNKDTITLHPENKLLKDIVLLPTDNPIILGKVVGCIKKF